MESNKDLRNLFIFMGIIAVMVIPAVTFYEINRTKAVRDCIASNHDVNLCKETFK